jgi:hypothetical protein
MFSPFPYFGSKRSIADDVWKRLGSPTQYIEPFCGSAAMLLAAPRPATHLRIALCGHRGDYNLPDWNIVEWSRGRLTYAGSKTTDKECVWYSPACIVPTKNVWE